jgi:hypothetical protein
MSTPFFQPPSGASDRTLGSGRLQVGSTVEVGSDDPRGRLGPWWWLGVIAMADDAAREIPVASRIDEVRITAIGGRKR